MKKRARYDVQGIGWRAATLALALAAFAVVNGCDNEELMPPNPDAGPLFARVVAIGNSITAGFQSAGISDSTQRQSYAALVAASVGTKFDMPLLNPPGCPPPVVDVFTGERIAGGAGDDCALRVAPIPTELNNVAVPGAAVIDVLTNFAEESSPNPLTTLLLGGRSQLQAAAEVKPTFAMVWIGNNDVLGAALSGDTQLITDAAVFDTRYRQLADSLADMGVEGAILVAVADVTLIPHLSPGAAYWQAESQGALPPTLDVLDSCAPEAFGGVGESTLVPFGYGFGELVAQASAGQVVTLDCANDAEVLTAAELAEIQAAIAAFNGTIEDIAADHGWAFLDPNPTLQVLRDAGEIPVFPNASGADAVTRPFGDYFSKDGVHPSALGHSVISNALIMEINSSYGTEFSIPNF